MDYKEAALVVARILEPFEDRFCSNRVPGPTGERDTLHYTWTLNRFKGNEPHNYGIQGTYACGSAVPLHAYTDATPDRRKDRFRGWNSFVYVTPSKLLKSCRQMSRVSKYDDVHRRSVREAWRPGIVDILPSAVHDCSSIEGFDGWEDWAHEFGALQDTTPAKLRELQASFASIRAMQPKLKAIFGDDWDTLTEACGNL